MKTILFLCVLVVSLLATAQQTPEHAKNERLQLAQQMETSIKTELLNKWYPQAFDTLYGGFLSTFTFDFKPTGPQNKFIVTQARHTWSTARAAQLYPDVAYYLNCSKHGFRFLRDVMWDKTKGGFYNTVDRQGAVKDNGKAAKEAYGNAFAIYALAAYYKASNDTAALHLAKQAFLWLDKHSHDGVYGGYYQHLAQDGTPITRPENEPSTSDLGYKDQNSSIHLLEAFTELYEVWPDALLRQRLQEMLLLIRDKITTKKGYLTLFFQPDWTPVSFRDSSEASIKKHKHLDHVSFGHDVETAYLMLEASHALGLKNDTATMRVGKKMVDHALQNGWDKKRGGFYDEGYYFKNNKYIRILLDSKNWWAQAEGLNTLLLLADQYPKDTMQYYAHFKTLWSYAQTYLIDHVYGDWFEEGLDKEPQRKTALKGHVWKATYHQFRALSNCVKRLRHDDGEKAK
ncbi:MAG TPA: AGE family epimerase/isomerase [Chitinophagaceae bacterium]|nr:AGE family epimerase/isomerase [Chitinophagaceae bacterium]